MPTEAQHIASANRTQKTIEHLLADVATHSPWIATAAFYKALHIVEAVLVKERGASLVRPRRATQHARTNETLWPHLQALSDS